MTPGMARAILALLLIGLLYAIPELRVMAVVTLVCAAVAWLISVALD
jgi:hypothetical protein